MNFFTISKLHIATPSLRSPGLVYTCFKVKVSELCLAFFLRMEYVNKVIWKGLINVKAANQVNNDD